MKVLEEFELVLLSAITLNNVESDRLGCASDLGAGFIHLELGQFVQGHTMHLHRKFPGELPDFQILVIYCRLSLAHHSSFIAHRSSLIVHRSSLIHLTCSALRRGSG